MTKYCVIVDVDGTISDLKHRLHLVRDGWRVDWNAFLGACDKDLPNNVGEFLETICSGSDLYMFIFTGRDEGLCREKTEKWLQENYPVLYEYVEHIYMRPAGDYRKDSIVKREMLQQIRADGFEPLLVIDDRPQVVDMWKEEGVTCLQHVNYLDDDPSDKITALKPGKLHMMVGPSCSGKSTYTKNSALGDAIKISSDNMRHRLAGDFRSQDKNNEVFEVIHELIERNIELGFDVWYDATNLRDKDRKAVLKLVSKETKVFYYVFDRPLAQKHEDAGWRADVTVKGGKKLIDYHHHIFQSNLPAIMNGDNDPRVTVFDRRDG